MKLKLDLNKIKALKTIWSRQEEAKQFIESGKDKIKLAEQKLQFLRENNLSLIEYSKKYEPESIVLSEESTAEYAYVKAVKEKIGYIMKNEYISQRLKDNKINRKTNIDFSPVSAFLEKRNEHFINSSYKPAMLSAIDLGLKEISDEIKVVTSYFSENREANKVMISLLYPIKIDPKKIITNKLAEVENYLNERKNEIINPTIKKSLS